VEKYFAVGKKHFESKKEMQKKLLEVFNSPVGVGSYAKVYKLQETLTTDIPIISIKEDK